VFATGTTKRKGTTMAWVESKGTGFRVRHRNPDNTIDTETGFENKAAAKLRAAQINAGQTDPTPSPAPASAVPAVTPAPAATAPTVAPTLIGTTLNPFQAPATPPPAPRPAPSVPTFEQWVRTWGNSHKVAEATASKYDTYLRLYLLPTFGSTPLDQITRSMIKGWGNHLHETQAASYADSILALLSTIFGEAAAELLIPGNPCVNLRLVRTAPDERVHADPVQILQIIARLDPLYATLVLTGAYTGMRWGELAGLAWDNVLLDQEIPAIRIPKEDGALHELGGKLWLGPPKTASAVRTVALPPFLAAALTTARAHTRSDFAFTAERGGWLRRSNFRRRMWDPAVEGAPAHPDPDRRHPVNLGMTFHGLRHSHKTWMKEDQIDDFVQNRRLGHATPSIGDRYSHLTAVMVEDLLTKLETRYHTSVTAYTQLPRTHHTLAA
jgi:integrase